MESGGILAEELFAETAGKHWNYSQVGSVRIQVEGGSGFGDARSQESKQKPQ